MWCNHLLFTYISLHLTSTKVLHITSQLVPFFACSFFPLLSIFVTFSLLHRWPSLILQVSRDYYKQKPNENVIPGKDIGDNTECKTEYKWQEETGLKPVLDDWRKKLGLKWIVSQTILIVIKRVTMPKNFWTKQVLRWTKILLLDNN